MYGLIKVTPQSWAWAMCAAWFSLCSCNSYRLTISSFNLEEFFFAIVKTLDDAEDPWAVETLEWINEQVFYKHAAKAIMTALNDADSDLAKMRAKCAAHKQRAPSTVASAPPYLPPLKPTHIQAVPLNAATHPPPAASNVALVGSAAVSVPPHRPITLHSRLPLLAPSSPLSLPPSPKLPLSTSMVKPGEPATTGNASAAPTDLQPPATAQ
ncbi:hypothetical protein EDD22DRAFT_960735 [Suillus occidentalis]|nr:hypothetical protein EDD22DRAFT_960735 [Suillus occidentalis]